jgi:hypothetical protein
MLVSRKEFRWRAWECLCANDNLPGYALIRGFFSPLFTAGALLMLSPVGTIV